MTSIETFGRKINLILLDSIEASIQVEREWGKNSCFEKLDTIIGDLLVRSLQGQAITKIEWDSPQSNIIRLANLTNDQRAFVDEMFLLENQQYRGNWFLRDEVKLRYGLTNFPFNFLAHNHLAGGITWEERIYTEFVKSADSVLIWSILEPLFVTLFLPFELRGRLSGEKPREYHLERWHEIDKLLQALGFDLSRELSIMRYGGGWHTLRLPQQVEVKKSVFTALASQVRPEMATRYRVFQFQSLVAQYYKKAKATGTAKRNLTLTKALERTLTGFFGGDWLAFLNYLGEKPHPDEQIATSLPQPRLFVDGGNKVGEIAEQLGIDAEDIKKVMAAFWEQDSAISPIEQRVDVLKRYWQVLDELHSQQVLGKKSLWGLIEDTGFIHLGEDIEPTFYYSNYEVPPHTPELYRQLLPSEILDEIDILWGSKMLSRWPEKMVTESDPHYAFAQTFGPALKFWHGCSLTAWFICEGSYSRTDMLGLSDYYNRELRALETFGTSVDHHMFTELIYVELILKSENLNRFEKFKIIITRYRRAWANNHLDNYLKSLWNKELVGANNNYHKMLQNKGTSPTLKQFAKNAEIVTNNWFGGNISGFYAAIGEKCPNQPIFKRVMPFDKKAFTRALFLELGGKTYKPSKRRDIYSPQEEEEKSKLLEWNRNRLALVRLSLWFIQLQEALERPPKLKEFSLNKFQWCSSFLSQDVEEAWELYAQAIERVLKRHLSVKV